jgi:hypothetical protein
MVIIKMNRLYQNVKNYIGAGAMDQWRHLQREWGNLSSALEKADSQWNKYVFERRHSRAKTILNNRQPWIHQNNSRKIPQKTRIYYFSNILFTLTAQKMAMAIEHQRSILVG